MTANIDFMKNLLNRVEGNTNSPMKKQNTTEKDVIMKNILDRFLQKQLKIQAQRIDAENDSSCS